MHNQLVELTACSSRFLVNAVQARQTFGPLPTLRHYRNMETSDKISYFGHVLAYYMHQNSLMWGRLTHCLTVQVLTISGAYATKSIILTPLISIIGAALSLCFILMFNRDRQIRDANRDLVLELANGLSEQYKDQIKNKFSTKIPPGGVAPFSAGNLFRTILLLIVIAEIAFGIAIILNPSLLENL